MILQVVIGVVIGGIILYYLPTLIAFGILGVIALVGLVVGAVALVWLYDNPSAIFLIGAISAGLVIYRHFEKKQFAKSTAGAIKRLEEKIEFRRPKGYDNNELYSELYALQDKSATEQEERKKAEWEAIAASPEYMRKLYPKPKTISDKARRKEHERRKKLGYEDVSNKYK